MIVRRRKLLILASLALTAFAQRPSFPRQYAASMLAGLQGRYQLPPKGNRLKEGWQLTLVETTRIGNPLDFHASLSSFTGKANLRPNVTGPVIIGFYPSPNWARPWGTLGERDMRRAISAPCARCRCRQS
jgi:hypothetical protein